MKQNIHTIIVKATTVCNLSCQYCSAHSPGSTAKFIDPNTIIALFKELLNSDCHEPSFKMIWHGGEPTLYSSEKADYVMDEISTLVDLYHTNVSFTIQSNGVFLPSSWMTLIHKYNIRPGISIDGPEHIHNQIRKKLSGEGSYKDVMETIRILKENECFPALLAVIDDRHNGQVTSFMDWLQEVDLAIKLNPCYICNGKNGEIFSTKYFKFLREIYENTIERHYFGEIAPINWMIKGILYNDPPMECFYRNECQEKYLSIDTDGRLSACGRLLDNGYSYGLFTGNNLQELLSHDIFPKTKTDVLSKWTPVDFSNNMEKPFGCQNICSALRILHHTNISEYVKDLTDFYYYLKNDGLLLLKKGLLLEKDQIKAELTEAENMLNDFNQLWSTEE